MTTNQTQQPLDSKPIVLLVDDSPDVHRLLKARLRYEDLELVSADGGEQGLVLATERKPTLMLLDLDMPGIDGFTVLRKVKSDPNTVNTAIIVLSGLHSPQDKVTAFDLGAVDYITKPFELTELRVRVRSALKMQRLLQMLSQKAQIDGLTGLWNRAFFNNRWAEEEARVQRHRRPLSIAMIDVDHFKSINDTYGHPAGDAVLQELAKLLQRECRTADIPCRYGGEEFSVIMPDTAPQDAMVLCERIRVALAGMEWARHPERKVTASLGLAGVSDGVPLSPEVKLVDLADQALYAAKRGGRNRVGLADVPAVKLRAAS
jgi:two-component system, cell cycle response regulator